MAMGHLQVISDPHCHPIGRWTGAGTQEWSGTQGVALTFDVVDTSKLDFAGLRTRFGPGGRRGRARPELQVLRDLMGLE